MNPGGIFLLYAATWGTVAGQCLLAVWAATSPRPLLTRVVIVWIAIVALIPIRVYFPALFFTLNAAVIFALTWMVRAYLQWRAPVDVRARSLWRFGLADLFALTLFVATTLSLWRYCHMSPTAFAFFLLLGLVLGPASVFSYFSVVGPTRWLMMTGAALAVLISAGIVLFTEIGSHLFPLLSVSLGRNWSRILSWEALLHLTLFPSLLGCFVVAIVIWRMREKSLKPMQRNVYLLLSAISIAIGFLIGYGSVDTLWTLGSRQFRDDVLMLHVASLPAGIAAALVAVTTWVCLTCAKNQGLGRVVQFCCVTFAVVAFVPMSWIYWQMLGEVPFPPYRGAGPNHYERIMAIGRELFPNDAMFQRFGPGVILQPRIRKEQQPLVEEAVSLLQSTNYVPHYVFETQVRDRFEWELARRSTVLRDVLMQAAEDAAEKKEVDRSIDLALAAIRFSEMCGRGGTTAHYRLAIGAEPSALKRLITCASDPRSPKSRELIAALDELVAERDGLEVLRARDRAYFDRIGGWSFRLSNVVGGSPSAGIANFSDDEYRDCELPILAARVLIALNRYIARHRVYPENLSDLTTEYVYLPTMSLDPYSGQPFMYRRLEYGYVLYSVGPDGVDNGGQFHHSGFSTNEGFDIDLTDLGRR